MLVRSNTVRRIWFGLFAFAAAAAMAKVLYPSASPTMAVPVGDESRRPVLVELFTSEGCSSCPPADELLARLDAEQFVPGARAIVLSEHVTYWNHEGWQDPFSFEAITDRQQEYERHFGLDSSFTPQAVIDGAAQVVGSDSAGLSRAIAQAAAPSLDLAIEEAEWSGATMHFKVRVGSGSSVGSSAAHNATLTAVLAEDSAQTAVKRGENAGRTLRHVAVVRAMEQMGKGALEGRDLTLKLPDAGAPGPMRLVVFAADWRSGRVCGVAERTLTR
jgi:hypothetical protein